MATQKRPPRKIERNDVIQCPLCGEDYSITYRRCPFCDELTQAPRRQPAPKHSDDKHRDDEHDEPQGRRTTHPPRHHNAHDSQQKMQVIIIVVTLALIITACFIVFKWVAPLMGDNKPNPDVSTPPSISTPIGPDISTPVDPDISTPITPDPKPEPPTNPDVKNITLDSSDVTLKQDSSFTLTATTSPSGKEALVVWSSSNSEAVSVSANGAVTNVNTSTKQITVTITATIGDVTKTCLVRAKGAPTGGGSTGNNSVGTIHGADDGLNVRSGAGTSFDIIASLVNGTTVTVVEKIDSNWYEITFVNVNNKNQTGYVSTNFLTVG